MAKDELREEDENHNKNHSDVAILKINPNINIFWIEKREKLEILKSHNKNGSTLKKKLGIINKLKNLCNENYEALLVELKNENFNKFHTEIINNLLINTKNNTCSVSFRITKIYKMVEILYLFLFDSNFLNYLNQTLKKFYTENWYLACLFLEMFYYKRKNEVLKKSNNEMFLAIKHIFKDLTDNKLPFCLYVLKSFDYTILGNDMKSNENEDVKLPIFSLFYDFIVEEIEKVNESNFEDIKLIVNIMGLDKEIKVKNSFVDIIKVKDDEFEFYNLANGIQAIDFSDVSDTLILKNIEKKCNDLPYLDSIGQYIKNKPNLVEKILKKKKPFHLISVYARVLYRSLKNNTSCFMNNILQSKDSSFEDLILLGELYKFDIIKQSDFFYVLEILLSNNVEKFCTLFSITGRYLLINKTSNNQTVELLEKLKKINFDEVNKIHIKQCVSRIFSPEVSTVDIISFFQWYFNSSNEFTQIINKQSERDDNCTKNVFDIIKESKKLKIIIFMQPSLFKNLNYMAEIIQFFEMDGFFIHFYLTILPKISKISLLLQVIEVVGYLCCDYDKDLFQVESPQLQNKYNKKHIMNQHYILNKIKGTKISNSTKYKCILILLDIFDKQHYESNIKEIVSWINKTRNNEIEMLLFNFFEKQNLQKSDYFDKFCISDDNFDLEMDALRWED